MLLAAIVLAVPQAFGQAPGDAGGESGGGSGSVSSEMPPYYTVEVLNPRLGALDDEPNLATPQAALEFYLIAARHDRFERAAHALDFRLIPDLTVERAARLAEQLHFVAERELWIDWGNVPDRPDGVSAGSALGSTGPLAGQRRRSLSLGTIDAGDREIPIMLRRVKAGGRDPVWVFSPQTVDNIPLLYEKYGPTWLEQRMPSWARERGWGDIELWKWGAILVAVVAAPVIGLLTSIALRRGLARWLPFGKQPIRRLHWPLSVTVAVASFWLIMGTGISLPGPVTSVVDASILILLILSGAWLVMRIADIAVGVLSRKTLDRALEPDSPERGRLLMQITVARHVVLFLIALAALGLILLRLDAFRTVGIALLSSAGAAAVIVGIAGHAVLGNLIAGLQIAFTQPFKIGDSVYIEDNWGTIESITYTYVVVCTWDKRRLVFPVSYFIRNWFENWSRDNAFLVKPIYLHVDFRADVAAIREKFLGLIREDERWDEEQDDPAVIVVDTHDDTMVVRCTCGAANPSAAWWMHCSVREKLVAWLIAQDDGSWLPRHRLDLAGQPAVEPAAR